MFPFLKKKKRWQQVIASLLIGVSIVSFWRGVWGLMDLYFFPLSEVMSYSFGLVVGLIVLYMTHHIVDRLG